MPVYLQLDSPAGKFKNVGKGKVHSLKQGGRLITPANLWSLLHPQGTVVKSTYQGRVDFGAPVSGGRRQHEPVIVRKEVFVAVPLFSPGLATNETINTLNLRFLISDPRGITQPYFTITLTNATIVGYRRLPSSGPGQGTSRQPHITNDLEEFEIDFQKISIMCFKQGKTTKDDWGASA